MLVKCPNCLTQYRINTARVSKTLIKVQCPSCRKSVLLNVKKLPLETGEGRTDLVDHAESLSARDILSESSVKRFGELLTVTVDGKQQAPTILIADEPRAFRDFLKRSLEELGCHVLVVDDGAEVERALASAHRPQVVFMNVVLRHTMGFTLCEKIKANAELSNIKVVLIGAIFRLDRFRRDPSNLYGADDYIEEIIVKHDLQSRMRKLLGLAEGEVFGKREPDAPSDVVDYARRLARIILSDIIIYNQEKADDAVRSDTFTAAMAEEIQEGVEYYLEKIPSDRPEIREIYEQTISDYVKRRRKELQDSGN